MTQKLVASKYKKMVEELEKITKGDRNWKEYKRGLKLRTPPVIPFLGVFMRDLIVLDEFKDRFESGEYNVEKLVKISEIVLELMELKPDEFTRVNHAFLVNVLCQSEFYSQDSAYKRSLELES